jgi:hypothetical protein
MCLLWAGRTKHFSWWIFGGRRGVIDGQVQVPSNDLEPWSIQSGQSSQGNPASWPRVRHDDGGAERVVPVPQLRHTCRGRARQSEMGRRTNVDEVADRARSPRVNLAGRCLGNMPDRCPCSRGAYIAIAGRIRPNQNAKSAVAIERHSFPRLGAQDRNPPIIVIRRAEGSPPRECPIQRRPAASSVRVPIRRFVQSNVSCCGREWTARRGVSWRPWRVARAFPGEDFRFGILCLVERAVRRPRTPMQPPQPARNHRAAAWGIWQGGPDQRDGR